MTERDYRGTAAAELSRRQGTTQQRARSAVCRFLCGGSPNVPVFERPTFAVRPIRPICRA
jgi:hypothetical protein